AFSKAYTALGNEKYRDAAVQAVNFLLENMAKGEEKRLFHTWKDDRLQYHGVLDDYAFAIEALLDIWQITFNSTYLSAAEKYMQQVLSYFHDPDSGLFFFTASDQTDVILRKKDLYDSATPSGNSTLVHALQRLGILLDRQEWREMAAQMLLNMQSTIQQHPLSFARWAIAIMN
ncbi:MAG: thioredoxin domain-containing protein, partial [Saprospiraceae bacterium]|nr:thioredoxin domain-containing protein [Saprospiraceae bacterium]